MRTVLATLMFALIASIAEGGTVTMELSPSTSNVAPGDQFNVAVRVIAGGQEVDAAGAYLDFDSNVLQVVSTTPGTALATVLQNPGPIVPAGTMNYAAGATFSTQPPTGTFTLVTVRFLAVTISPGTPLVFHGLKPRQTGAARAGVSVFDTATGGAVVIAVGPTPTITPTPAATPTGGIPAQALDWAINPTDAAARALGHLNCAGTTDRACLQTTVLASHPSALGDGDIWVLNSGGTHKICYAVGGVRFCAAATQE
jgi:hypothetical protein